MNPPERPLPPNSAIGILGGGQLAQMLSIAAVNLGYLTAFIDPDPHSPAQKVSTHVQSSFTHADTLELLGQAVKVVTLEFENVPPSTLETLERSVPVYPAKELFQISRNRILEKKALAVAGLEVAPYWAMLDENQLAGGLEHVGGTGILKTAELGYDGKGQIRVSSEQELLEGFKELGNVPCVLEDIVPFARELSVQVARNVRGEVGVSGVYQNVHVGGILKRSVWPPNASETTQNKVRDMALELAAHWNLVGLLTLELFELPDGSLWVNEIAPRVHNSGHLTLNGGGMSQFEAQIRAVAGLPLHDFAPLVPCAMVNILGWEDDLEPDWSEILTLEGVYLHLYGKRNRPGRKMGHVNVVGERGLLERVARVEGLLYGVE